MSTLRSAVEAAGAHDVSTHIQSGNVLLRHELTDRVALTAELESAIGRAAGFAVPVILRTGDELAGLVRRCPFTGGDWDDDCRRYASFLSQPAERDRVEALLAKATPGESLYVSGSEVCAAVRRDTDKPVYGDIERILKVPATARAWNVVEKLAELATR